MALSPLEISRLRTAIILLDRPLVGRDGHRGRERLPDVVRLRATVVGVGSVTCALESRAVAARGGGGAATWADLQAAWQAVAASVDRKIRAGALEGESGDKDAAVRITAADIAASIVPPPGHDPR